MKNNLLLRITQIIAVVLVIIAAIGSLIFTIQAGHKNKSILLPVLFIIWVLSPYFALLVANFKYRYNSVAPRIMLNGLMIIISIVSLLGYSGILNLSGAKPAAVFLITPLISWVIIIITVLIIASKWGSPSKQN